MSEFECGELFGGSRGAGAHIEDGTRHLDRTRFRGGSRRLGETDEGAKHPTLRGGIDLNIIPVDAVHIFDIGIQEGLTFFERCDFLGIKIRVRTDVKHFAGHFEGAAYVGIVEFFDKRPHDPSAGVFIDLNEIPGDAARFFGFGVMESLPLIDGSQFGGGSAGRGTHEEIGTGNPHVLSGRGRRNGRSRGCSGG